MSLPDGGRMKILYCLYKLPGILSGQRISASGGTNIAVYNIHKRLKLLYGENYGLYYSSTQGQGTEVRIKLPASKLQDE